MFSRSIILTNIQWKFFPMCLIKGMHAFIFVSTGNFHLNMVVLSHFPKLMLKWRLTGTLLKITINCLKFSVLFRTINEPNKPYYVRLGDLYFWWC